MHQIEIGDPSNLPEYVPTGGPVGDGAATDEGDGVPSGELGLPGWATTASGGKNGSVRFSMGLVGASVYRSFKHELTAQ